MLPELDLHITIFLKHYFDSLSPAASLLVQEPQLITYKHHWSTNPSPFPHQQKGLQKAHWVRTTDQEQVYRQKLKGNWERDRAFQIQKGWGQAVEPPPSLWVLWKSSRDLNKGHEIEDLFKKGELHYYKLPISTEISEGEAGLKKGESKKEISFVVSYLWTLFSLSDCFSLAFSSWILSFPSCQKETFTHQLNCVTTPVSPLPHCKGKLYLAILRILICPSLAQRCLWTLWESTYTPIHPTCFTFFCCDQKADFTF